GGEWPRHSRARRLAQACHSGRSLLPAGEGSLCPVAQAFRPEAFSWVHLFLRLVFSLVGVQHGWTRSGQGLNMFVIPSGVHGARNSAPSHAFCAMNLLL